MIEAMLQGITGFVDPGPPEAVGSQAAKSKKARMTSPDSFEGN